MKFKTIANVTESAFLLTACGNGFSDNSKESESSNGKGDNKQVIALDKIKTSPKEVVTKAQEVYSEQNLKGISYEKSNGEWVYKIE